MSQGSNEYTLTILKTKHTLAVRKISSRLQGAARGLVFLFLLLLMTKL